MKKRTLIALALVLAIALVAQTGVWADKLQTGVETAPAASSNAGARPAGTVNNGTEDSVVNIVVISEAEDVVLALYTGDAQGPSGDAFLVEIDFNEDSRVLVVELGPDGGTVSYWDAVAEEWVELEVVDGTVTVPDDAPDNIILAVVLN